MSANERVTARDRERLRAYVLGTLTAQRARRLEERIQGSDDWRRALAEERANLARLDRLPDAAPKRSLAVEALERIDAATPGPKRWALGAALAAATVIALVAGLALYQAHDQASRQRAAEERLRQWGVIFKMYAAEDPQGRYPPLSPYGNLWIADLEALYPHFFTDPGLLVNPMRPGANAQEARLRKLFEEDAVPWREVSRIAAQNYSYPGHAVTSLEDLRELAQARPVLAKGESRIPGLREGIERFLITDINNPAAAVNGPSIPVLVARPPDEGRKRGVSVLYLDGHVERLSMDGPYPATPEALELLAPPGED